MEITIRAVRHQHTGTRFMNILTQRSIAARDEKLLSLAAELTATRHPQAARRSDCQA